MPSIQPLDLVIPFKNDYIVIPCTENDIVILSIELLNLGIRSTENYIVILFIKDCIVIPYQLHCDSFYRGLHCNFLYRGSCTGCDIVNLFTKDCIGIPSIESYM